MCTLTRAAKILALCLLFLLPSAALAEDEGRGPFYGVAGPAGWLDRVKKAKTLHDQNDLKAADQELNSALSLVGSSEPKLLAQTYWLLMTNYRDKEDFKKSDPYLAKYIETLKKIAQSDCRYAPAWQWEMGNDLLEKKRYQEALRLLEPSIPQLERFYSPDHPLMENLFRKALADSYKGAGNSFAAKKVESTVAGATKRFMNTVSTLIKQQWHPPQSNSTRITVANFKISQQGRPRDCRIETSSGDTHMDRAALSALEHVTLPLTSQLDFYSDEVAIEFSFTYNVHNGKTTLALQAAPPSTTPPKVALATYGQSAPGTTIDTSKREELIKQLELDLQQTAKLQGRAANRTIEDLLNLTEQRLNLGQMTKAKATLEEYLASPEIATTDSAAQAAVKGEMGCLLLKELKLDEASKLMKEAISSEGFEKIESKETRRRLLKAFGDCLYKQGKEAEACEIYKRVAALK